MMKLYRLVLNGESMPYTVGATDWIDATEKLAKTHEWFAALIDETDTSPVAVHNRRNTRISFEEVK